MENTGGSTEVLEFSSSAVDKIYKKLVFEKQAWTEFALKHWKYYIIYIVMCFQTTYEELKLDYLDYVHDIQLASRLPMRNWNLYP